MRAIEGWLEQQKGKTVSGVACGRCGAIVEPGRLSCAACGSLLASVTGGTAEMRVDAPPESPEPPELRDSLEAAVTEAAATGDRPPDGAEPVVAAADRPDAASDSPVPAPAVDRPATVPGSYVARWSLPAPRFPRAMAATTPSSSPASPPPVLALASPPIPAAAAAAVSPGPSRAAPAAAPASPAPAAGRAGLLADLPLDAPDDIPSWLVLIGSVVALASFVLPWASPDGIVLGTQGGPSYLDRWGLASLSDVGLFIATLALLVLAIVPNRLPLRFRFGYLPIVLGGVDLGVAWVYVGLTFGYGTGIVVLLFGAILLIIGSSMALRHPSAPPAV